MAAPSVTGREVAVSVAAGIVVAALIGQGLVLAGEALAAVIAWAGR